MKKNMIEWRNSILNAEKRIALPIMTYPGLSIINKSVLDMVTDGDVQYACVKALFDRYPSFAATNLIMDLSVEAEVFGSTINFSKDEIPTVSARLIDSFVKLSDIQIPKVGDGRTAEHLKAAQLASMNLTGRPLFGGIIGPYSLAGRLFDITEMMTAIYLEPDCCHELLKKCVTFQKEYAKGFKDAGADGIIIAEPAAGLLAAEQCDEFSSRYVKMIVDYVQDENFMVILHNCGNTLTLVESMVSTGSMGFHFGNAVDMINILPQVPSDRLVFGNIDPAGILKNGTYETVKAKTLELLNKTSAYRNFILSSGCDIPPGTSLKNLDSFNETLNIYNNN